MTYTDPLFWLVTAFAIFTLTVILKYSKSFNQGLNSGIDEITNEIKQTKQLLADAEKLLIEKRAELDQAEQQALDIEANAKEEIEILKAAFKEKLKTTAAQLELQAAQKIEKAERDAFDMIKNTSVEIAINAARKILEEKYTDPAKAKAYIAAEIENLKIAS